MCRRVCKHDMTICPTKNHTDFAPACQGVCEQMYKSVKKMYKSVKEMYKSVKETNRCVEECVKITQK